MKAMITAFDVSMSNDIWMTKKHVQRCSTNSHQENQNKTTVRYTNASIRISKLKWIDRAKYWLRYEETGMLI